MTGEEAIFDRDAWAALRASVPLPLSEEEIERLRGINEFLSIDEVQDIYLPLSRLLNLRVGATRVLQNVTEAFLGVIRPPVPFVVGVAGSVAVGKSTTARVLQAVMSRWPDHPRVELITTDGFLHPNAVLEERSLMARKGFPESYDVARLLRFLADLKTGVSPLEVPVYDHLTYDVVADQVQVVERPDVVILEGLNVLQTSTGHGPFVSDYFDWSIYVDAEPEDVEAWYVDRFRTLRTSALRNPEAFFHRFADLSDEDAATFARGVWTSINLPNLHDNILPTRPRADLVLAKGSDHRVRRVHLRMR